MAGSRRFADKLGQGAVQGILSPFKAGSGRIAPARLLPAHAKSARGALTGRNAAALARAALAATRGRFQIVHGENHAGFQIVQGRLVGGAALPVKDFHHEGITAAAATAWNCTAQAAAARYKCRGEGVYYVCVCVLCVCVLCAK